ncbi:MAG: hypothetical protein J6W84_06260 [Bacteroidales bacterium]|nr:hypothetical protein [Bacteroidales bacterium]
MPKGGYGYFTLYRGIYDPSNNIDERPAYAETGDLFEPYNSSVVYKATRSGGKTTWAIDENAKRQSETGEGGSGGSLPANFPEEGVANAGKFIGFDASGDYTAKDAPSGAEKFVVTLTEDDSGAETVWTADKSAEEIAEAKEDGKIVVATMQTTLYNIPLEVDLDLTISEKVQIAAGVEAYVAQFSCAVGDENVKKIIVATCVPGDNINDAWAVSEERVEYVTGVPSYGPQNYGKVLGVSSGSLAWVDSNAPLIVTLTDDGSASVGDKTFGEVYAAMGAGKNVVLSGTLGAPTKIVPSGIVLDGSTYKLTIPYNGQFVVLQGAENDYITVTGG